MAFMTYLNINGENLPLPISYDISLEDVEADTSGETEAGTRQRDLVRSGVVTITLSFNVTATWLQKLSNYRKLPQLTVMYFDIDILEHRQTTMYMDGFKSKLEKDTSKKGLWSVSFTLKEF